MHSSIKTCKLIKKEWLYFFFSKWNLSMSKPYNKIRSCNPLFINKHFMLFHNLHLNGSTIRFWLYSLLYVRTQTYSGKVYIRSTEIHKLGIFFKFMMRVSWQMGLHVSRTQYFCYLSIIKESNLALR